VWCRRVLSTICVGQYRRGGRLYSDCFTAAEVIDCLLDHEIVKNVKLAVIMGQELIFLKKLLPVYIEADEDEDEDEEGEQAECDSRYDSMSKLMSPRKKDLQQINRDYASLLSTSSVASLGNETVRSGSPTSGAARHVGFFDQNKSTWSIESNASSDGPDAPAAASKYKQPSLAEYNSKLRKLTSTMDTHFVDDKGLYRLNLQGEQVTEWLLNSKQSAKELKQLKEQRKLLNKEKILVGYSFGIFGPDNQIRDFCATLVTHKYFEYVVLVVIIASSICLAIDEPGMSTSSSTYRALNVLDYIFTVFFVLEMLVKMISTGVFGTSKAYFSNGWNVLDFVIVVISVVSLALVSMDLSYLKAFRALRSLRPLRMVSRSPALIAVVNAIIMVTTPLANFALVICVFLFTFAILGTSLFKDKFVYCKASSLDIDAYDVDSEEFKYFFNKFDCVGNATNAEGALVDLEWVTRNSNFDNIFRALLTLFELITMEAWPSIMYPAMDIPSNTTDHPIVNNSKYNALFFIVFIVVGAFFITNLFVGIIVYKFRSARESNHGSALLTAAQQKWLDDIQVAMTAKPIRHSTLPDEEALFGFKRPIHLLVINEAFMVCMDMLIILNILVMALEHFNQSDTISRFISIMDEVFTGIFTIEILLRFIAVTPKEFVALKWNRIDAAIVLVALIDTAGGSVVVNVTIFRVFRVARLFRLIKDSKDLIVLVKTLYFSLPSLINVGTLLFLSFFVFAIVGMNLFGGANTLKDGVLFNDYANFDGFLSSMLLLFQCMTGENWNSTMYVLKNQGFTVAVPFFAFFLLVNKYMLLNLFIAIILENFEAALQADPAKVAQRNLEDFIVEWSNIRKEIGSADDDSMPSYCLVKILHCLDPPLGIRGTRQANLALRTAEDRQAYRRYLLSLIRSLDLKEDSSGRVFFVDVVFVRRGHASEDGENTSVVENMSVDQRHELLSQLRHLTRKRRMTKLEKKMKDKVFTEIDLAVEVNSAIYIQAIWRGIMNRKKHQEQVLCDMLLTENNQSSAPRIVLNRTDSKKLRAVLQQTPGTDGDTKVRKALRILRLGSQSFSFMQKRAVRHSDDSSDSDLFSSDSDDSFKEVCPGKFYRPRVTKCDPLEVDYSDPSSPPPKSESTPTKLLSAMRNASFSFNLRSNVSRYWGGGDAPTGVVRKRHCSVNLDELADSKDDFNYFTVYEDKDDCMVLTHVNSQRAIMDNLFAGEKKKKKNIVRRQSTVNVPPIELEEEFEDLDVYVMKTEDASSLEEPFEL
jgi:hypothetical protein